ncbi:uncharacterized protein WCC33_009853 [Rhinophrynus dorsalis]
MTLLIELYLLHGKDTYIDRVVGWGVFPLCNNNFNILEGRFKCPFLRGHYDTRIDRFSKIEQLIMTDMDHWLCNLYFQIIKLPQYLNEQKEYDVFVHLPREFLSYATHAEEKKQCREEIKKSIIKRDELKQSDHSQDAHPALFFTFSKAFGLKSQLYGGLTALVPPYLDNSGLPCSAASGLPLGSLLPVVVSWASLCCCTLGSLPPASAIEPPIDPSVLGSVSPIESLGTSSVLGFVLPVESLEAPSVLGGPPASVRGQCDSGYPSILGAKLPVSVGLGLPIIPRQPPASQTDHSFQKEIIHSSKKDTETQSHTMKGEAEEILKKTQAKMHQKCSNNVSQACSDICFCVSAGIRRNKIVPYVGIQSNALPLKEDFDRNQTKLENDRSEQHFQWAQKSETNFHKQAETCSTSTSFLDELEKHRFSVCSKQKKDMHVYQRIVKRTSYIIWAVFSEMELGQWRSHNFWTIMLMMALMWFMRLYMHYCSQWLFLHAISIPVIKFTFYPHTVELTYQSYLMHTREEMALVVLGPMALNISMILMILLRWCCQTLFDFFPAILSKFIIALGLWTVLDPLAVFIVDAFLGRLAYSTENPIADAAKLYWIFYRAEQSGIPGIFITLLIYTMIFIISCSVLYIYFLRIHKESWILDVFQRISCDEEICHVPYDLEISNQELSHIVRKAERWRGINGERRKVTVYDYIWKNDTTGKSAVSASDIHHQDHDITTHVLIFTIHLNGLREIYRQFFRLSNGAIVEIFGDFNEIHNMLPNEVSIAANKQVNEINSLKEDSTKMDLRDRKQTTT